MSQELSPYTAPGHLLRRAGQLHDRFFEDAFQGIVTPRQFAIMLALARNPSVDQITLSSQIAVDRSTIGDMVGRLNTMGFIARERDKGDGRRNLLKLTPSGHRVVRELLPKVALVTQRLLEPLSESDREVFVTLLAKVATAPDVAFPDYRKYALAALGHSDGSGLTG
jgi:DNA-binding MarR family transcriptional regulator